MLAKVYTVKAMVFPVIMYGRESWPIKKVEHQKLMLSNCGAGEDSWSPLDSKEIKPVKPKGNQRWIFIGTTEDEAEVSILWAPDVKSRLTGKDPEAGKDWRQKEKGVTEDETVGWYHQLNGHEFEQTRGGGEGQGSLVCCSLWGRKASDTTSWLTSNSKGSKQQAHRDEPCRQTRLGRLTRTGLLHSGSSFNISVKWAQR